MATLSRRRVLTAVTVVVMLALAAALARADRWWPAPDALAAPAVEVTVAAGRTELVCPGPPRVPVEEGGLDYDPAFDPAPQGSRTTLSAFALSRPGGTAPRGGYRPALAGAEDGEQAFAPENTSAAGVRVEDLTGPGVVTADPVGQQSPLVAGATVASTARGDLRGLAAQTCSPTAASAWLVAGGTEVGSSSRLVLTNPGVTPATVSLSAWGAAGPLELGQLASVLVPPGGERAVLLESVVPDEPRLAVHLTVAGGHVAATVQDSALRGFVPAGVDLVGPTAEPSVRTLVPALVLVDTDIDDPHAAVLRVLNPGTEPAEVQLRLLSAEGDTTVPGAESRVVDAGTVADVSLAGVPAGAYTAELVSDRPVTAAAMLPRVGSVSADDRDQRIVDRAWLPAGLDLGTSLVPLPGDGSGVTRTRIVLGNPGDEVVEVEPRVATASGGVRVLEPVSVPPRSTVVLEGEALPDAVGVELVALSDAGEGPTFVAAALLMNQIADGPLIAGISAQPDVDQARSVAVRLPHR